MTAPNNACVQSDDDDDQSYNLEFHIASVFAILILSLLGASISVVSARVKQLHIKPVILDTGKFFGSGVVLATGFIHILPAAMEALTDPCLPDSWNVYEGYAGLFAMSAALAMQLIEYIAHQRYRSIKLNKASTSTNVSSDEPVKKEDSIALQDIVDETSPLMGENHGVSGHSHGVGFQDDNETNKISTYLLEFGIALHSVLIGLALGTATDEFVVLFIALCFHQFFEGMALGAQIARLHRISLRSAIFMVVFFALTTPVGIAVGIGIRSKAYTPKSVASLLVSGILDSVSGGILIYVALVNLITAEMGPHADAFHSLSTRLKVIYFAALYSGAGAMATIGRWA